MPKYIIGDTVVMGEMCSEVRFGEVIATEGEIRVVQWRDGEITRQRRGTIESLNEYEKLKHASGPKLAFLGHMYEMFWRNEL